MRIVDKKNTEFRRETILKGALDCFSRNGIHKTSISDICKATGMRSGHLYYYFSTKDAIIEAVFRVGADEMIERIEKMLDGGDFVNSLVEVHAAAETYRQTWNISPGLRLEFQAETARNERLRNIYEQHEARTAQATISAVRKAISLGLLDSSLDPEQFSRAIGLLWSGFASLRIMENFNLEDYRKAIAMLLDPWLPKRSNPTS